MMRGGLRLPVLLQAAGGWTYKGNKQKEDVPAQHL